MADKRCKNGHFIDESWDICPYCPPDKGGIADDVEVVQPRSSRVEPPKPESARKAAREPERARQDDPERRQRGDTAPPLPPPPPPAERTVAVGKVDLGSAAADTTLRWVVAWLVGLNGVTKGESFPVRMGRNIVGRDRKSDIYVNDDQASAHHADLVYRPDEGRFILMDHNSTNGTFVNEVELEPRRDLADRDIVTIGRHKFMFVQLSGSDFNWDDQDQHR